MKQREVFEYLSEYKNLKNIKDAPYTPKNEKVMRLVFSFISPLIIMIIAAAAVVGANMFYYDFDRISQMVLANREVFGIILGLFYLFSVSSRLERLHKSNVCDKKRLKKLRKECSKDFLKKFNLHKGNLEQVVQKAQEAFTEHSMYLKYNRFFLANVLKTLQSKFSTIENNFDLNSEQDLDKDSKNAIIDCGMALLEQWDVNEDELGDHNSSLQAVKDDENNDEELEKQVDESSDEVLLEDDDEINFDSESDEEPPTLNYRQ